MRRALQIVVIAILCVLPSYQDDCTIKNNGDITDLTDLELYHEQPRAACCTICQNTVGCKGFEWNKSEGGTCLLKGERESPPNGTFDDYPNIVDSKEKSMVKKIKKTTRAANTQIINRHNEKRRLHGVGNLQFNSDLQVKAERCCRYYASINQINHSCKESSQYGENLYAGSYSNPFDSAFNLWYDENQYYDYSTGKQKRGSENEQIGHFTQIVWKNSQQVGCGLAERGSQKYVCCVYSPPGNYIGQYTQNVFRS